MVFSRCPAYTTWKRCGSPLSRATTGRAHKMPNRVQSATAVAGSKLGHQGVGSGTGPGLRGSNPYLAEIYSSFGPSADEVPALH